MSNTKPYAKACDENAGPILEVLQRLVPTLVSPVLEIGSGTGQHSVFFSRALPHLQWQTSDLLSMHSGIQMWIDEASLPNLLAPLELDVSYPAHWPSRQYPVIFTANTTHIMPKEAVADMFRHVGQCLINDGVFIIYGPFMYGGEHTSESNWQFDLWIRARETHCGLRNVDWLQELAHSNGLYLDQDIEMPANNRILVWKKSLIRHGQNSTAGDVPIAVNDGKPA